MRSKLVCVVLVAIFIQGPSACKSISATRTPQAASPDEIVQGFYQAMNDGDLETALTFIADNIECRGHCYITGKVSFQAFIQSNIDHNDQFEISDLKVDEDKVTFNYIIHRENAVLARGVNSVMEIQDGKIIYFEIN